MKTCDCAEKGIDNCKEIAETELRRKLDLLLRTGSILMESAADTSRIMRTMKRAAAFLGRPSSQASEAAQLQSLGQLQVVVVHGLLQLCT